RLAGAVVAEHRHHLAGEQLQAHVLDGTHAAEGLVHALDFNEGCTHDDTPIAEYDDRPSEWVGPCLGRPGAAARTAWVDTGCLMTVSPRCSAGTRRRRRPPRSAPGR